MDQFSRSAGSIYESFNARNLSPMQVARTFIPPRQFDDLVTRQHSLVIGPRGSGKTTLLKMLQLQALASWSHPDADRIRREIDFTGVFVASDVSWGQQLANVGGASLPSQIRHVLGRASLTTHILSALVDAFRDSCSDLVRHTTGLAHQGVDLSRSSERDIAAELTKAWHLEPDLFSFDALKIALARRQSEILSIAERESLSEEHVAILNIQAIEFLHLDFLAAAKFGTTVFNIISKREDKKYALLVDELEIAPRDIQRSLYRNLRSGQHDLLFKLSLSPLDDSVSVIDGKSPQPRNDYHKIELWYPRKENAYSFSESLVRSMIEAELPGSGKSPTELFGESEFDPPVGDQRNQTYAPGGKAFERFKALATRDPSFKKYLARHEIDLDRLHEGSEDKRAEFVRKVTHIVAIRETFRGEPRSTPSRVTGSRSRKNPDVYAGARSLFAIAEGNPRWLIGLFSPLIREIKSTAESCLPSRQSQEIAAASHTFRALLATFPYRENGRNVGLLGLLDRIGDAFFKRVVIDDFSAQPPLSFKIDRKCDQEMVAALGLALNAGAIVYVPSSDEEPVLTSIRDKRFRLSYMLAPGKRLPLHLGIKKDLSSLLNEGGSVGPLLDRVDT